MGILTKDELIKKMDGEAVSGYVLIKSYDVQPTKNGGSFIGGTIEVKGSMPFKVWSNCSCFEGLEKYDYENCICYITGKANIYGGTYSVIIETCKAVEDGTDGLRKSDFFAEKYSVESYWNNLVKTVSKNTSEDGFKVFSEIFTEDVKSRFCEEFAARSHHDNCRAGLLAHTAKVVKMCTLMKMYPEIVRNVETDLLFVGSAVHDVGKIREYSNGVMSEEGKRISHNVSGIIMLEEHRDKIVELKGEEFYIDLLSIISGHHGEYGEKPRTIVAYVIHLVDCLDSVLTMVNQQLETATSNQIVVESMKLVASTLEEQ